MIKILFLIPGLSEGGAEKVLRNLVNNMDQAKFDITVQTIERYDPKQYLADGIHYKAINRCKTALGRKLFSYWFRLCAELKLAYSFFVKGDYDIEVAYLECGATKIIAQSTNKRAVKLAWVHCDLSRKEGMEGSVEKVREQYRAYDKIVCVSEDVRTGFHKLYGPDFQTVVLHNIMDEEEIFHKARELLESVPAETYLLAVGRLTQQKNFAHLVDICGKLRSDGYRFHLDILGEGPERESLQRQIKGLHLESIVDLKGFTNNPYPYMKAADWIVCSSRYEGISTVVQEALILDKPVVTTPCTGMKELLGDSEFGLIAEDSEDGLYHDTTIFIDADCLAYGDLNRLFDYFDEADDFSCFGRVLPLDDKTGWFEYENLGELQEQVSYVVGLHGGIYYMRKSETCRKIMEDAKAFVPDYPKYKFKGRFSTPGDEPLVALSMAVNNCRPVPFQREAICCYWEYVGAMSIDITGGKAKVEKEPKCSTILLHWGTRYTRQLEYQKQVELLSILETPDENSKSRISQCKSRYDRLMAAERGKRFAARVKNKIKRTLGIQ